MYFVSAFLLITPIFITPILTISALFLPPNSTSPSLTSPRSPVLCYDRRYATHYPTPHDCLTVINQRIVLSPIAARRRRTFSRTPGSNYLKLPYTWDTIRQECSVTIDIPGSTTETAVACLEDVKEAALDVLAECVYNGDHLGGVTHTGLKHGLQVSLQARVHVGARFREIE
ncbi:MAG: hypothetical protein Q9178_003436 [Gyalolechia marmorata]